MDVAGFDWHDGNRDKCQSHGLSIEDIESLFARPVMVLPDDAHSLSERRLRAIGRTPDNRYVFVVFTLREKAGQTRIRPISARYMHAKEVEHYEEENPDLQDG